MCYEVSCNSSPLVSVPVLLIHAAAKVIMQNVYDKTGYFFIHLHCLLCPWEVGSVLHANY